MDGGGGGGGGGEVVCIPFHVSFMEVMCCHKEDGCLGFFTLNNSLNFHRVVV